MPATRLDDDSWRLQVKGSTHLNGAQVVHPIDAVSHGDGDWSVTTPIARLPKEDSSTLSSVLRAVLSARGNTAGVSGPFIDDGVLVVGVDPAPTSPRELVGFVEDVAQTASSVLDAAVREANAQNLQLPWL